MYNLRKKLFFICFIFANYLFSQDNNLIMNPSFEDKYKCPTKITPVNGKRELVPGWNFPTGAAPDYFNRCHKKGIVGVPKNFAGESHAQHGNAYMGIILYTKTQANYREYLQSPLLSFMEEGKIYCVSLHYRLSSKSKIAVDRLGVCFSNTEEINNSEMYLPKYPEVENEKEKLMDDKEEWKELCGVYRALGGENFIIIGNFAKDEDTEREKVKVKKRKNKKNKYKKENAYYYIDNISVVEMEDCFDCDCVPQDLSAKILNTKYTKNGCNIKVKGINGTPPYLYTWSDGQTGSRGKRLSEGNHEVTVKDDYNCEITIDVDCDLSGKQSSMNDNLSFKVKAKSNSNNFTGNNGSISLYVTGGKSPYKFSWSNGSKKQNLKNLSEGMYEYTVTDEKGKVVSGSIILGKAVLNNVIFHSGKADLRNESFETLNEIAEYMKKNSNIKAEISGHTDSQGAEDKNQELSERRAQAVVDYLVEKGIDAIRFEVIGYGEETPIANNSSAKGRQKNRRVEFKIIN